MRQIQHHYCRSSTSWNRINGAATWWMVGSTKYKTTYNYYDFQKYLYMALPAT